MATPPMGLLVERPNPTATLELIDRAEQHGVPTAWSTIGATNPDAVTLFAAAATRTHHIALGTSIVPIYPRHPLVLASQALVLADLAPGRLRLGIGPSHRPIIEGMFGIPIVRPLVYMREYLTVLRQLLWGGQVDLAGEFLNVHATLPAGTTPPRIPLLISALGANSFRLAGEAADGAISWMCPITYLTQTALPALRTGAASAQRAAPPLIAHVPVAMHTDRDAVRAAARQRLGTYGRLPFYARMFADAGYPIPDDGTMPDALFDALVVSGEPAQVAARLAEIRATGIDEVLVQPVSVADQATEEAALFAALAAVGVPAPATAPPPRQEKA
jgi:F420-dependent oxidoreductase-like protein